MKITQYGRLPKVVGTVTNSLGIGGVSFGSNSPGAAAGTILVATSSNTFEWRDALSFGSNTNDVSSIGTMGASASNTRADHVHRGVHLITSSASNTLYGDINLRPGGSVGFGLDVSTQTLTISATGGGSSGFTGVTHSSNTATVGLTITNDGTLGITHPAANTLHFSAPFRNEVVTNGEDILVWHGADLVHHEVRLY